MANTFKVLHRGNANTSDTTLYTVPAATTTLVNNILVANTSTSSAVYTMAFDGFSVAASVGIPANDTAVLDIKQVLTATNVITGYASASTVTFHLSGLEIS